MLQLCCQADTELLNTTELQDKVKEAVRSVPVEECIPLTKQLLQYITLSALKMERVISACIYVTLLMEKCIFISLTNSRIQFLKKIVFIADEKYWCCSIIH